MDSLPTGHLCLSGAISPCLLWSGGEESVASALCFMARRVSSPLMSHFHKLFIDQPWGIIAPCSFSVPSTRLLICMEVIIFEPNNVPAVQSVNMVSKEINEAYNKGSEVSSSVSSASTSFILVQIGFGWLEITFSPG